MCWASITQNQEYWIEAIQQAVAHSDISQRDEDKGIEDNLNVYANAINQKAPEGEVNCHS